MSNGAVSFVAGLVIGAAITLVVVNLNGSEEPDGDGGDAARLLAKNTDLEQQLKALESTLETERTAHQEELLAAASASEPDHVDVEQCGPMIEDAPAEPEVPAAGGPPTMEEIAVAMRDFRGQLEKIIRGTGDEAAAELREFFARVDGEAMAKVLERYEQEDNMQAKLIMSHVLAQSGRPEAIARLREIILDQNVAFTDRRLVSHGLAFVGDPALEPLLLEVGRNDPDRGVRANASFGLARTGSEEGLSLYAAATDEAFREKDPAAIEYLSGFSLLGEKALPQIRERLVTYEDPQSRMVLIQLVKKQKDRESLPILQQLERDPKAGQAVQEEARKAIDAIEAPDEGE